MSLSLPRTTTLVPASQYSASSLSLREQRVSYWPGASRTTTLGVGALLKASTAAGAPPMFCLTCALAIRRSDIAAVTMAPRYRAICRTPGSNTRAAPARFAQSDRSAGAYAVDSAAGVLRPHGSISSVGRQTGRADWGRSTAFCPIGCSDLGRCGRPRSLGCAYWTSDEPRARDWTKSRGSST